MHKLFHTHRVLGTFSSKAEKNTQEISYLSLSQKSANTCKSSSRESFLLTRKSANSAKQPVQWCSQASGAKQTYGWQRGCGPTIQNNQKFLRQKNASGSSRVQKFVRFVWFSRTGLGSVVHRHCVVVALTGVQEKNKSCR